MSHINAEAAEAHAKKIKGIAHKVDVSDNMSVKDMVNHALSEFGKIATLGIVCAFITYYFLFPAQALFYDKIHWLRKPRPPQQMEQSIQVFIVVIVLFIVIMFYAAYKFPKVKKGALINL